MTPDKPGKDGEFMLRVRMPADLATNAQRICAARDETISQVVRRLLRAYVAAAPTQIDLEDAIAGDRVLERARKPRKGA